MNRFVKGALGLVAIAGMSVAPANAAGTPVILAGPAGYVVNYTQPVAVAQPGDSMDLVNLDVQPHDVVATTYGPGDAAHCVENVLGGGRRFSEDECPIFWSKLITVGNSTPIRGLENLESGTLYEFVCSIHNNMNGTLVAV